MLVNHSRLQAKMDEEGLDGIVVTTPENVYYFTGIWSVALQLFPYEGQCYAIITRDTPTQPCFISSRGEIDQILDGFDNIREVISFGSFFRELPENIQLSEDEQRLKSAAVDGTTLSSPLEALVYTLQKMKLADKSVGIDELGLRLGFFDQLKKLLPNSNLRPASELLRWIRRVKTSEELRRIAASARVVQHAILAAKAIIREGVTEREVTRELERSIVAQGGLPKASLIRFGRNGVAGQVLPGSTQLKKGDTIWFDIHCIYEGYWADVARVFSLGEPSQRVSKIYKALLEGEQRAIEETRPGMTGNEVFELTVETVRQAGISHYRRHHVGHGIGLEVYEQPILRAHMEEHIQVGMVINIETPYYEFGLGALHVEDPFVVGTNGNQLLTTLDRELMVID